MKPEPGMWLYASCAGDYYGQITRVGKDDSGADVIDIIVQDVNELIDCNVPSQGDVSEEWPDNHGLTSLVLPPGVKAKLIDLQWKPTEYEDMIVCNTPGNLCYRCTKLFTLERERRS
jgi:hypothetical protein